MSDRRKKYPTAPPPWCSIGEVVADLTESTGRVAIARLLQCTSNGDAQAFREADVIRRRLGLEWADLIEERKAA